MPLSALIKRHYVFIVVLALIFAALPIPTVIDALALRPSYPFETLLLEGWRLFTGHIVHASWPHVFVNVLNLVLLRFVFREWISNSMLVGFLCFSAVFISIGLWLSSDLYSYVGFSGVFHGLLVFLLLQEWKRAPALFTLALVCLVAKILYEQLYGASPALASFIGIGIATDSHALGLVSGVLFFIFIRVYHSYYESGIKDNT